MITYKYCVYDDDYKIKPKCFDTFEEAFDYAQNGLITFIEEVPYIDGIEQQEEAEIVWSWDDVSDRNEAISRVNSRHSELKADLPIDEDIEISVVADSIDDLNDLAKAMFGDNIDFFDQNFEEPVPSAEINIGPVTDEPEEKLEDEEQVEEEPVSADDAFEDDLYPEVYKEKEPEDEPTEEEKEAYENLAESFSGDELDRYFTACKKLGLVTIKDVTKFAEDHGNLHDQDLLAALEAEADKKPEITESADDQVECIWCLSPMSKSNCVHDKNFGWICKDCLPDIEKLGNRLHLDEPEDDSDAELTEQLFDIYKDGDYVETRDFENEEAAYDYIWRELHGLDDDDWHVEPSEDDMSDEEFLEAFGNAIVEKHNSSLEESKDVPVVDCPVNDVITHSEDEKPLDCEMKKEPLEKPLAEDVTDSPAEVAVVSDLIKDEVEAIDEYNDAKENISDPETREIIDHISAEEVEHIDELADTINEIPEAEPVEDPELSNVPTDTPENPVEDVEVDDEPKDNTHDDEPVNDTVLESYSTRAVTCDSGKTYEYEIDDSENNDDGTTISFDTDVITINDLFEVLSYLFNERQDASYCALSFSYTNSETNETFENEFGSGDEIYDYLDNNFKNHEQEILDAHVTIWSRISEEAEEWEDEDVEENRESEEEKLATEESLKESAPLTEGTKFDLKKVMKQAREKGYQSIILRLSPRNKKSSERSINADTDTIIDDIVYDIDDITTVFKDAKSKSKSYSVYIKFSLDTKDEAKTKSEDTKSDYFSSLKNFGFDPFLFNGGKITDTSKKNLATVFNKLSAIDSEEFRKSIERQREQQEENEIVDNDQSQDNNKIEIIEKAKKFLNRFNERNTEDTKTKLRNKINALADAIDDEDIEAINSAKEALKAAEQNLGQDDNHQYSAEEMNAIRRRYDEIIKLMDLTPEKAASLGYAVLTADKTKIKSYTDKFKKIAKNFNI